MTKAPCTEIETNPPEDKIGPEPDGYLCKDAIYRYDEKHQIGAHWRVYFNQHGEHNKPINILEHSTFLAVLAELRHAQDIYVHDFNDAAVGRIESLLSKLSKRQVEG